MLNIVTVSKVIVAVFDHAHENVHVNASGNVTARLSTAHQGACARSASIQSARTHGHLHKHFARSASTQSVRHPVGAKAPQATERGAALQLWLDGSAGHRIGDILQGARWSPCCAPCVVATVVAWCDDLCSATALVPQRLGDSWLCATRCWVSCLVPSALHVWMVFLVKFCVPSLGPTSSSPRATCTWSKNARRRQRAYRAGTSSCLPQQQVIALWQVLSLFGPTLQESCGSHCRKGPVVA